jgi:hypothetical protein
MPNENDADYMKKQLITFKEARDKNKMEQFIREREKEGHPPTIKRRFEKVLKSMASGIAKPKRGTSR